MVRDYLAPPKAYEYSATAPYATLPRSGFVLGVATRLSASGDRIAKQLDRKAFARRNEHPGLPPAVLQGKPGWLDKARDFSPRAGASRGIAATPHAAFAWRAANLGLTRRACTGAKVLDTPIPDIEKDRWRERVALAQAGALLINHIAPGSLTLLPSA
jgi:hypothetical protein